MATRRGRVDARSRTLAVATALGVHVLLLVMFAVSFTPWPAPSERPVLNLQLAPPLFARKPAAEPRRRRKTPQPAGHPRPTRAQPSASPAPNQSEALQAPQPQGLNAGARQALRDLIGCQSAGLLNPSSEERQRCEDRMTAIRKASAPLQLNLDPRGLYVVNPVPYLNRRPKNGCKVIAGGDAASGQQGVAVGIACGKTF